MKFTIVAVGKARDAAFKAMFDEYAQRLRPPLRAVEVEEKRKVSPEEMKSREAALLLAALPVGARVAALDRGGRLISSEDLAALIGRWRDAGAAEACFVIGGSDGLGAALLARADERLSFGPATWPHQLFRVMLAEQLYRATAILAGAPYHK